MNRRGTSNIGAGINRFRIESSSKDSWDASQVRLEVAKAALVTAFQNITRTLS